MLGTDKPSPSAVGNAADLIDTGTALMQNGAYADAFLLLSKFESDSTQIAVLYNLSLCYFAAGETQKALECAEKSFAALNRKPPVPPAPKNPLTTQNIFASLSQSASGQIDYLKPMPRKLPEMLPDAAKRNVLRLLVDLCAVLDNPDGVLNYAGALLPHEKNYENVTKAVEAARKKKGVL